MNILMVIDRYYPIWGGAENQLRQIIPFLENKGCKITILTRRWHKEQYNKEMIDGTLVYRVGFPGTNFFSTISYIFGIIFFALKKKNLIDIVHTHGAAALGAVGRLVGFLIKKPNISKISTAGRIPILQKSFLGKIILYIFKLSNAIVCMSDHIYTELIAIKTQRNRIIHIKNGVNISLFKPANAFERKKWRHQKGWAENTTIIVFSGRFVSRKGIDILIEAWSILHNICPNTQLFLLGSGENQKDSIENKIRMTIAKKRIKNIHLEGNVDTIEYLRVADIFAFPSRIEGISNALLEAMSCSLIPIATSIGGNEDIIENNKTGILVEVDNINAFIEIIKEVTINIQKHKKLGRHAREYVVKNHAFEKISDQYFSAYSRIKNGTI